MHHSLNGVTSFPEARNEILQFITRVSNIYLNIICLYTSSARACAHTHSRSRHDGIRTHTRLHTHLSAVCIVVNYASILKTVSLQKPRKWNDVKVQTHLSPKMFSINLPLTCVNGIRVAPTACGE